VEVSLGLFFLFSFFRAIVILLGVSLAKVSNEINH
jgi:hypothetical protein